MKMRDWPLNDLTTDFVLSYCVQVLADVTGGPDLLARAIAGSYAVIVATGFRPSFDLTASWKVWWFCNIQAFLFASKIKELNYDLRWKVPFYIWLLI